MTTNCNQLGALVIRIQNAFLTSPATALTLADAQRRFGLDRATCKAVLDALVDAKVLAQNRSGAYVRFFPRVAAHAA